MVYFLYTLFFISCIVLIASVLLQPGKTDAGALFTSNLSSTAFQPRGAQTILSKISIAAAVTFMLSALLLSMPALTGSISVLQTSGDVPAETQPVVTDNANVGLSTDANTTANAPAATDANINGATNVSPVNTAPANTGTVNAPANK